jgi:hypothetical protein
MLFDVYSCAQYSKASSLLHSPLHIREKCLLWCILLCAVQQNKFFGAFPTAHRSKAGYLLHSPAGYASSKVKGFKGT